ncbi:hypothetical protein [Arenimonas fontis]|uniref:Lipoprotein n=1 Tax=Arenimonas fontis TaxID=2608255 RepID=A0A5B2ZDE1_9GAMM|nr:hypothetical protein [Arenimonas fontis]KAA2285082.1 hypothetical protein F0415_07515 [Arenimonas fontis]
MKIAIAAAALVLALAGCRHVHVHDGPHHKDGPNYVLVCHKGKKTLELPREAVDAHLAHGDWVGRC